MWLKAVVVFLAAGLEWCDRKAPFALHHNHSQVAAQRKQVAPQHSTSIQEMEEIEGSPKELELIGEFKKLVQPHLETEEARAFCDDGCLKRYLRAREYNMDKALEMLKESITWRAGYKPTQIPWHDVREDYLMGKMYTRGFDKERRPIVIFRPSRDVDSHGDLHSKVRFYVWMIEYSISKMDTNVDQMVWLLDMNGYSVGPSDLKRVSLASALISTLQNQYPERVHKMIVVSPPWYLRVLVGMIRPILSQRTMNKMIMDSGVTKNKKTVYEKLLEEVDPGQLETCFGGELQDEVPEIERAIMHPHEHTHKHHPHHHAHDSTQSSHLHSHVNDDTKPHHEHSHEHEHEHEHHKHKHSSKEHTEES